MKLTRVGMLLIGVVLVLALGVAYVQASQTSDEEFPLSQANPVSPEQLATNVAETAAMDKAEDQRQADAANGLLGTPAPKDPLYTLPPDPTEVDWQGAILPADNSSPPAGDAGLYHWINGWTAIVNGKPLEVVAGSLIDQSHTSLVDQGVVQVNGADSSLNGLFQPPTNTGPLAITAVQGTCLTLKSSDQTVYQFEALTHTWSCTPSSSP